MEISELLFMGERYGFAKRSKCLHRGTGRLHHRYASLCRSSLFLWSMRSR